MTIFFYHTQNKISKKIAEATGKEGFTYLARPHMEEIIKADMKAAGFDIYPDFYCSIGSMAGTIADHLQLNPDIPLHRMALKASKAQNQKMGIPWAYVKINNGPQMRFVIGWCNSDPTTPFLMSNAQMAQKGIIQTSIVPGVG